MASSYVQDRIMQECLRNLTPVKLMVMDGATPRQVAQFLGISLKTLQKYRAECKEFDNAFIIAKDNLVDKLESKLYQSAMGMVDKVITHTKTIKTTKTVENPETGEVYDVVEESTSEITDTYQGWGAPDMRALEIMLKANKPEVYDRKEDVQSVEAVVFVDDIANKPQQSEDEIMFYDDSVDANTGEESQ